MSSELHKYIEKAIDKKEESINLRNYQNEYILGFGDVLFIKFKESLII